jgi:hypothetical protein
LEWVLQELPQKLYLIASLSSVPKIGGLAGPPWMLFSYYWLCQPPSILCPCCHQHAGSQDNTTRVATGTPYKSFYLFKFLLFI